MDESGSVPGGRFRDARARVYDFVDEVLVRCPACDGCAVVLANLGASEYVKPSGRGPLGIRRRLRCGACGLFKDAFPTASVIGAPVDPYFQLPLWLQAECRGHVLWAYNVAHLDLLESYVAARLRERGTVGVPYVPPAPMSLVERLPAWLKSAKNRDEVMRTIRQLRSSLPAERQ